MDHARLPEELHFFTDPVAELLFAKIDYALRDSVHIQFVCDPDWHEFVATNEQSLVAFYKKYLSVQLLRRGQGRESYYFLDFFTSSRGNLGKHYKRIDNSYLLIGFFLYKVKVLERNIELRSITEFKRIIREDYQDLRPGINRIARSSRINSNPEDNDVIAQMVDRAFELFARMKWLRLNDDEFEELPAFQRLVDAYALHIQDIDEHLKI
jgi:hypothetical protein